MGQEPTPRNLPSAQGPVYRPDPMLASPRSGVAGRWEGRIKDAKTGTEIPLSELEELLSWLETHKDSSNRRSA